MSQKILVADDSATIQKVVSITLANEPCELIEALDLDALFQHLENESFTLLLLDFNLTDEYSGYELAKKVREIQPDINIIAMLGTFDSVEDGPLKEAGISEVVVKPFESSKFIQSCRSLMSYEDEEELTNPSLDSASSNDGEGFDTNSAEDDLNDDLAEGWVSRSPSIEDNSFEEAQEIEEHVSEPVSNDEHTNPLQDELLGWGMEMPGVIGSPAKVDDDSIFPPKIDSGTQSYENVALHVQETSELLEEAVEELSHNPFSDPDLEETQELNSNPFEMEDFTDEPTKTMTISLNDLQELEQEQEQDDEDEMSNVDFSIKSSIEEDISSSADYSLTEDDTREEEDAVENEESEDIRKPMFQSIDDFKLPDEDETQAGDVDKTAEIAMDQFDLEKEIEEEENPETFWATDEKAAPSDSIQDMESADIIKFGPGGNSTGSVALELTSADKEEIINAVTENIKAMLETMVKDYCESRVDTVAWEVIPDLAENLIKQEIKELSESAKN